MQIFNYIMLIYRHLIFSIIFITLSSCNSFKGTTISEDSLEILIVSRENIDNKNLEKFKRHFFLPQLTIPETEMTGDLYNIFDLTFIDFNDFTEYFHGYQNIVFLSPGSSYSITEKAEKWHPSQVVLNFMIDTLSNEKDLQIMSKKLINEIKEKEVSRRIKKYKNSGKAEIRQFLKKNFDLSISLSNNFSIVDTINNFLDLRRDFDKGTYRLIISKISGNYITRNEIINEVNEISKNNIYSDTEGAFANIDDINANVYISKLTDENNIFEIRGLWKMYNDPAPMGGPILSYVINDKKYRHAVIFIFYIFAPGEDKADHLIEAEAIGKSLFTN